MEGSDDLFRLSGDCVARHDHVGNCKLFDGAEQSGVVSEVDVFVRGLIGEIGVAVSLFDPHRLLGKLLRAFQIVGIKLLRIDVIVLVGVADGIGSFLALNRELVFVALIEDVPGTERGKHKGGKQGQLDFLPGFGGHDWRETLCDETRVVRQQIDIS